MQFTWFNSHIFRFPAFGRREREGIGETGRMGGKGREGGEFEEAENMEGRGNGERERKEMGRHGGNG